MAKKVISLIHLAKVTKCFFLRGLVTEYDTDTYPAIVYSSMMASLNVVITKHYSDVRGLQSQPHIHHPNCCLPVLDVEMRSGISVHKRLPGYFNPGKL